MNDRQRASFGICVTESGLQSGCGFSLPNSTISFEICIRHNACCCRIEPARSVLCISNEKLTGALRIEAVRDSVRWFPAGAEQRRSLAVIDEVPRQLQNRNKQFAVSGIGPHARRRDYMGVVERLTDAGTLLMAMPLLTPELPIRGNRDPERMNLYFHDTGLLAAAMKEHARESCAGGDCGRGFASHEDAENAD